MGSPYSPRWDPREDCVESDHDWIGEDRDGVWMCRHPTAALRESPAIWPISIEIESGLGDITESDFQTKSNYHFEAKMSMVGALHRERIRRSKGDGK